MITQKAITVSMTALLLYQDRLINLLMTAAPVTAYFSIRMTSMTVLIVATTALPMPKWPHFLQHH